MSIKLMQLVWDRDLPQSRKFLLLSLADQANDAGECWPSISTLATRCSMGRRTVFDGLADLEAEGWLSRDLLTNQRVKFSLNIAMLQQLPLGSEASDGRANRCGIGTSAKSAPVRDSHQCENRTGAESGRTGAKSALHKATPNKSNPHRGGTRTREEQLEVMGSYDRRLIEPFLEGLPASIEVQVLADYVKHCQVKRGPLSISSWQQVLASLRDLERSGVDLNESLRETMLLQLVKPVDPRKPTGRGGAPPGRVATDFTNVTYGQGTPDEQLPDFLRKTEPAATD